MTLPQLTWHQAYPRGRIVARLGKIEIGVVFLYQREGDQWRYMPWIGDEAICQARSEQEAKDALTAYVADWLREAGLEQVKGTKQ